MKKEYEVLECGSHYGLETEINDFAKRGWRVVSAYGINLGGFSGDKHYAVLERDCK